MPIVKKIHCLERAQYACLDHSKTLVFSDVIEIEILFKYSCARAIYTYSSRGKKTIYSHLKWSLLCNLTELCNNKEHLCSLEGLQNCYAHAPVHSSAFSRAQQYFVRGLCLYICQGSVFPSILLSLFVHLHECML